MATASKIHYYVSIFVILCTVRFGAKSFDPDRALSYYNTIREAARRRQPGAQPIFELLRKFFHRRHRTEEEPEAGEING